MPLVQYLNQLLNCWVNSKVCLACLNHAWTLHRFLIHLCNMLSWRWFFFLLVDTCSKIAKCCIIYKRLQGHVPTYLKSLLKLSCETHSRQTRYANFNLACPIVKRQKEGGRTFTVTTCKLWNSLPLTTRKLTTLSSFKKSLWKNIFNNQLLLCIFFFYFLYHLKFL